jgi:hypothetical protein
MAWHFDSQALAELALENFQPTSQDLLYFTIMPIYTKSRNA